MYYEIDGTSARLLGSVHILPAEAPVLPDWVCAAYQWADTLVLEHDQSHAWDGAVLREGDSLEHHLPAPLWNRVMAAWPTDRPLAELSSLKPWAAVVGLPRLRLSVAAGVEGQFTQRAQQDKKPITYLETLADVAALGDAIPRAAIEEALRITLAELPNAAYNFMDLHQAWLSRDIERVASVAARTPLRRMPELATRLLDMRNEAWVPRILALASSDWRVLIAPGALHLPGENGLLALLKRAGHRTQLISEGGP